MGKKHIFEPVLVSESWHKLRVVTEGIKNGSRKSDLVNN